MYILFHCLYTNSLKKPLSDFSEANLTQISVVVNLGLVGDGTLATLESSEGVKVPLGLALHFLKRESADCSHIILFL